MQPTAIILAAGNSKRMNTPKILLPWGNKTVIENITACISKAGISQIYVVCGAQAKAVTSLFRTQDEIHVLLNPDYENDSMLVSLQVGIRSLAPAATACLVFLGDQPMIRLETIQKMISAAHDRTENILIPSYQFRGGHPWLVKQPVFPDLLNLPHSSILRDYLHQHQAELGYVEMDSDDIMIDIDTPADYEKFRPQGNKLS